MDSATRVQILDKAFWILLNVNAFAKSMKTHFGSFNVERSHFEKKCQTVFSV